MQVVIHSRSADRCTTGRGSLHARRCKGQGIPQRRLRDLPAARRLLRDGVEVELEAKVFYPILSLVDHHARAPGKQEIIEVLWGRRPITDAAPAQLIYKARRACDDDGERQTVIRTIYGRGLQWSAYRPCRRAGQTRAEP